VRGRSSVVKYTIMMQQTLRLAHLYPEQMSIYGDRGNIIALRQRCAWRGIGLQVVTVELGATLDWASFDLAFFGGGQDSGQMLIAEDLSTRHRAGLHAAVDDGLVLLAICGGYQMLGHYFLTHTGEKLPGLDIIDVHTVGGRERLIGNIVLDVSAYGLGQLVGFENHSGRTYHGGGVQPFGRVLVGHGDNGEDGSGGAIYRNTIGCYLHGSLLPKNPHLTDWMIERALRRRYGAQAQLEPLEAELELQAQRIMVERLIG
jgi:lipid II isoglutaminyl synthase (glutamine-hydrolysing)